MKYKALVLDLDGTTIPNREDGLPSSRVIDAINKAKEKIHVCVATGRSPEEANPVLDQLKLSDPVIVLNGALILDSRTRKPIYEQPMRKEDFAHVIEELRGTDFHFTIDEHERMHEYDPDSLPQNPLTIFVWDLTEEQADMIIQQFSHIPTLSLYKVRGWLKDKVGLNISHKLATKQHAVLEVAKKLGIKTHEMIGVGDGPNDFPLLMACGLKVAIGNAIPDLKAIADYIAPTVEEDGVAEVIEKFILDTTSSTLYNKPT